MFEGTEKKLEILTGTGGTDLRALGREFWTGVVHRSRAEILSVVSNEHTDAYLLSESSLFVQAGRMIMITCGRTRLVDAAHAVLERVAVDDIVSLIYERKNENFPELQPTTFEEDVARLREVVDGSTARFGDPHGHWLSLFHRDRPLTPDPEDHTLELLLYGLAPDVRPRYHADRTDAATVRRDLDLDRVLPGFLWDDHVFQPKGYSLNGIRDRFYATVHVTPDDPGSYASFETNLVLDDARLDALCSHVMARFRPERADLVLFREIPPGAVTGAGMVPAGTDDRRLDCGYRVHFQHYRAADAPAGRNPS